jgi:pilus assembly protein Flp/PilA
MVDPSVAATMEGKLNCVRVGDHAADGSTAETLGNFPRDESGATAIEYSLIAGFIALAIIAAVGLTGQRLVQLFESLLDLMG